MKAVDISDGASTRDLLSAPNGGSTPFTTDNGYVFAGSVGQTDITSTNAAYGTFTGFLGSTTTGDAGLDNVINTSFYGSQVTYTLNNLTPGDTYTVLVFAADDRGPGQSGDSVFTLTDGATTSNNQTFVFPNGVGGAGAQTEGGYLLDTFTATDTNHLITVGSQQEDQGILVEAVVPEPSSGVLMLGGLSALALGFRFRRRTAPLP